MHHIRLENIGHQFADVVLFNHLTITFSQSASYAIQGVSGSGKSTLLYIIAGILQPTRGVVWWDDEKIVQWKHTRMHQHLSKDIGFIFQLPYLMDELSVEENVMVKGLIAGQNYADSQYEARQLLQTAGLASVGDHNPHTLSGGEAQRIAVLRGLYNKPAFLLADEPTAHLDPENRTRVLDLLRWYKTEYNMGIIIMTHDPVVAEAMDYTLVLSDQRLQGVAC